MTKAPHVANAPICSILVEQIGISKVAAEFGIYPSAVRQWRKKGVPASRRDAILTLAAAEGKLPPATEEPTAVEKEPDAEDSPPGRKTPEPRRQVCCRATTKANEWEQRLVRAKKVGPAQSSDGADGWRWPDGRYRIWSHPRPARHHRQRRSQDKSSSKKKR